VRQRNYVTVPPGTASELSVCRDINTSCPESITLVWRAGNDVLLSASIKSFWGKTELLMKTQLRWWQTCFWGLGTLKVTWGHPGEVREKFNSKKRLFLWLLKLKGSFILKSSQITRNQICL